VFRDRTQVVLFALGVVLLVGICLQMGSWWPLLVIPAGIAIRLYYAKRGMISDEAASPSANLLLVSPGDIPLRRPWPECAGARV